LNNQPIILTNLKIEGMTHNTIGSEVNGEIENAIADCSRPLTANFTENEGCKDSTRDNSSSVAFIPKTNRRHLNLNVLLREAFCTE